MVTLTVHYECDGIKGIRSPDEYLFKAFTVKSVLFVHAQIAYIFLVMTGWLALICLLICLSLIGFALVSLAWVGSCSD